MKYVNTRNKQGDGPRMITVNCDYCGEEKEIKLAIYNFRKNKGKTKHYCNKKCISLYLSKYGTQICEICNTEIPASKHKGHKQKYCSRKCYDIAQNKKIDIKCLHCGEIFNDQPCRRFCSRDCSFKYAGETSIEKKVREELNKHKIYYETQVNFKSFYLDFVLPNKIVIECDGIYWHSKSEVIKRDKRKNKLLKEEGYTLFRFTDRQINKDVNKCIQQVIKYIEKK